MCCGVGWCVDVESLMFWVFVELWVVGFVSGGSGRAEREACGWSGGSAEVGGWHVLQGVFAMAEKDVERRSLCGTVRCWRHWRR